MIDSNNLPIDEKIVIPCDQIDNKFAGIHITTDKSLINKILETWSSRTTDEVKHIFKYAYRGLTMYTEEEFNEHKNKQDQQFTDWCNDVFIFYVLRLILLNKPIPIMDQI